MAAACLAGKLLGTAVLHGCAPSTINHHSTVGRQAERGIQGSRDTLLGPGMAKREAQWTRRRRAWNRLPGRCASHAQEVLGGGEGLCQQIVHFLVFLLASAERADSGLLDET
jgi:hypothetical protein